MNLQEKGWFQNYLLFRNKINITKDSEISALTSNKDFLLYRSIQPTGLMYGHPVLTSFIKDDKLKKLAVDERMKVVLIESLLQFADYDITDIRISDNPDFSNEFASSLIDYYLALYPELEGKATTFWGRKKEKEIVAEEILDKRLYVKGSMLGNLWVSFFHNSLLFLDVLYFRKWMEEKEKIGTIDQLRKEKEALRYSLLQVIAAASYADSEIEHRERKLFNLFLKSADLDQETSKKAKKLIDERLTVDDITLPEVDSWIIRKYILELAILTIWADQEVVDEEKEFIQQLGRKLGFLQEEMDASMVAIESFVLTNWNEIQFFLKNKDYKIVGKLLVRRISKIAGINKDRIGTEIRESKELMNLMAASMSRELTVEEKEKVRVQLIDILKMLPTFAIIALPGTFLTLPILLSMLPKSVLPSAFQE